jgi:hypothetical protein
LLDASGAEGKSGAETPGSKGEVSDAAIKVSRSSLSSINQMLTVTRLEM